MSVSKKYLILLLCPAELYPSPITVDLVLLPASGSPQAPCLFSSQSFYRPRSNPTSNCPCTRGERTPSPVVCKTCTFWSLPSSPIQLYHPSPYPSVSSLSGLRSVTTTSQVYFYVRGLDLKCPSPAFWPAGLLFTLHLVGWKVPAQEALLWYLFVVVSAACPTPIMAPSPKLEPQRETGFSGGPVWGESRPPECIPTINLARAIIPGGR